MNFKKLISAALCASMLGTFAPAAFADTQDELAASIDAKTETLLKFEGNFNDEKGANTPTVKGTSPTFTDGQSGQGALFVTKGGYLDFSNYIGSKTTLKNKSIAFSIKTNKLHPSQDPAILGNTDWNANAKNGFTEGFTFAYEYNNPGSYKSRIAGSNSNADATKMTHAANVWQNYVLSFDDNNRKMYIYQGGELIRTLDYSAKSGVECENTKYSLKLGNDGTGSYKQNSAIDYSFVIDNFMITSSLLTDEEIAYLNESLPAPVQNYAVKIQSVNAAKVPADSYMNFNLYTLGVAGDIVKSTEFDINYDTSLLTYDRAQFNNATITEPEPGHLHIVTSKTPSTEDITNYSTARITQLVFRTADVSQDTGTELVLSNGGAYASDASELENVTLKLENPAVTICAKDAMDKNHDGFIGAGDVALASDEEKADIAAASQIRPYKRAIAVTIDGAGRAWSDNAVYNGKGITSSGTKIEGEGLENVRNNPYCIDMFNNEMAVSDSAISMDPPISAQNYCSILHGVTFSKLPSAYKFTNDIAGASQWPDYGLETPKYPSFLRAINQSDPTKKMYAYAEWHPITNGVLEQNSGAYVDYLYGSYCFDRIADYIKAGNMKDTTVAYMQSDVMDHYGHSYGYFTDGYYELLGEYDTFFPTMINALKDHGLYDDTLILVNADHGGHNYWHGTNNRMQGTHGTYSNLDDRGVFIAAGGQTVRKGAKLSGGTNDDIAALIFEGLRMDKPSVMSDSTVFDSSVFMSQEELSETGRTIEKVTAAEDDNSLSLSLSALDRNIKAAEVVITSPFDVSDITPADGVTLLRSDDENGKLHLVFAFDKTPSDIAKITFSDSLYGRAKLSEVMLADEDGNEIYCDIDNDTLPERASTIIDRLAPSGDVSASDFADAVSQGFSFKINNDTLDEEGAKAIADITYDSGIKIIKKTASQRMDLAAAFTSNDAFASDLYELELDIEQINAAPMYISTKWRNFITLNWLADGTIDVNAGKATLSGYKNKRVKFRFVLNYKDKYLDIYANDVLVSSKCALRTDASGSNSPSKPMTFNINMTDAGAAGSGMKLYGLTLDEYRENTFAITYENGIAVNGASSGEVMAIADSSLWQDGAALFIATYNADGSLSGIDTAKMSEKLNTATGLVTVPEGGYAKAFLWTAGQTPIK